MTKSVIYKSPSTSTEPCDVGAATAAKFKVEGCGHCIITVSATAGGPFPILRHVGPGPADFVPHTDASGPVTVAAGGYATVSLPGVYQVDVPEGTEATICSECFDTPPKVDSEILACLQVIKDLIGPPAGIEIGALEVGCVKDADGKVTGKVHKVLTFNEDGTFAGSLIEATMYGPPAATVSPYTGPIENCSVKFFTTQTKYIHEDTCEIYTLVRCYEGSEQTSQFMENPDGTTTETINMAGLKQAETTAEDTTPKTLEAAQKFTYAPTADFSGTVADIVALAGFPDFTAPDASTITATAAEICGYCVEAISCKSKYIPAGGDTTTAIAPTADATFIDEFWVRGDEDDQFAGVDLTATVKVAAGSVSKWEFQYKLEGSCDKAGVFTPNP